MFTVNFGARKPRNLTRSPENLQWITWMSVRAPSTAPMQYHLRHSDRRITENGHHVHNVLVRLFHVSWGMLVSQKRICVALCHIILQRLPLVLTDVRALGHTGKLDYYWLNCIWHNKSSQSSRRLVIDCKINDLEWLIRVKPGFLPAVLLRAFDFQSPPEIRPKTEWRQTHKVSDENKDEWMQFLKV